MPNTPPLRLAVDIGGTFTDILLSEGSKITPYKILTKKLAPEESLKLAIESIKNISAPPIQFLHSSTIVTNMIIEHKGSKTALITTEGMRDILHIGRHKRPLNYAIAQTIPWQHFPPIPRSLRFTVKERIDFQGKILTPLDEKEIRNIIRHLVTKEQIESVAICFLHSYKYPAHEQRVKEIVLEEAPHLEVSLSCEISPRFREYERFMTTALNARVQPTLKKYLSHINEEVGKKWKDLSITVISSNGGLETISKESSFLKAPIKLALSGPAAAGNAVASIAKHFHLKHCVGLDIGGTSADIMIVKNGTLAECPQEERQVASFPLQTPMLDLHTLGAGGGSLIYQDDIGELHVGPQSASSLPGPASYDLGGTHPTLTDAALIAKRLPQETLLAGHLPLKAPLAYEAFKTEFPTQDIEEVAQAALKLAEANIAFAIREQTVARGINPRELTLVVAGGAGGLLATGIADIIEISEIIIPTHPGLLAAWGLLTSPLQYEETASLLCDMKELNDINLKKSVETLNSRHPHLTTQGFEKSYHLSLRYHGQGFEVDIVLDNESLLTQKTILEIFHQKHFDEYNFNAPKSSVELIELRVRWNKHPQTFFPTLESVKQGKGPDLSKGQISRELLPIGFKGEGPFIISEQSSTTYIDDKWQFEVLEQGYLKLTKKSEEA